MTLPRALVFDVFGTLVDWRGSIARQLRIVLGPAVDAQAIAEAWRGLYQPAMEAVRGGREPYVDLDALHRANLDQVLAEHDLRADAESRERLVKAWHALDAWPDVGPALRRLRSRFLLAPCSNGHIALMVGMARHNGWHWDAIAGADLARTYKPRPEVYRAAASALGCSPSETMMVAAHSDDLAAAAAAGLRTAHIARPDEYGPGRGEHAPTVPVELAAADLGALADRLGCD